MKVDATLVKLAMPPPMMSTLPRASASLVMRERMVLQYSYVCSVEGAPLYSP